jgi:hypothetical protein
VSEKYDESFRPSTKYEIDESARFDQMERNWENQWKDPDKDPDDVFFHAQKRKHLKSCNADWNVSAHDARSGKRAQTTSWRNG